MAKIKFFGAENGGIAVFHGVGDKVGWAKTPEMLAYLMKTHGIADTTYATSDVDFCTEYGFAEDGAAGAMIDAALEIYNWEVNGVAG